MKRGLGLIALGVTLTLAPLHARADDYVTVRGAYYREPSTRVIQPTVELERDSPTGWDVKAHYLVDTITSASVAAGTTLDSTFTETRNEAALMVRKRWDRSEVSVSYKYSAESDYWSHGIGVAGSRRLWGDTARVGLSLGVDLDSMARAGRTPYCATAPSTTCYMQGYFAGLSYTQILSPVLLAQVSVDSAFLDGFQANLYRQVPDHDYERVPDTRLRNAFSARVAYYIPRASLALRLQYRYYVDATPDASSSAPWIFRPSSSDPWRVYSHTIEARVYRPLTRSLSARLSYRQYIQWGANFWCTNTPTMQDCYGQAAVYYSTDPKLGRVHTEYPEAELIWQAEALREVPVLGWLSAGTFTISYGRYFQNTSFGDAHVLQTGYTLPY